MRTFFYKTLMGQIAVKLYKKMLNNCLNLTTDRSLKFMSYTFKTKSGMAFSLLFLPMFYIRSHF